MTHFHQWLKQRSRRHIGVKTQYQRYQKQDSKNSCKVEKGAKMNMVTFTRLPREVFHNPRGRQLPASVQAVWQGGWNTPWGCINKGTVLKAREGKKSHHARLQSNYSWRTAFNFAHGILSHLLTNWRVCRAGTQNDEGTILWGVLKGTEHNQLGNRRLTGAMAPSLFQ